MNSSGIGLGGITGISGSLQEPQRSAANSSEGFSGVLSNALQQVNQLNGSSEQQIGNLLKGANTDMSTVMIAVEKADVAFQLMMQVRNKIVSAYQDIEKMQF
jgi:flagellar hook-basal body complex protein FliE